MVGEVELNTKTIVGRLAPAAAGRPSTSWQAGMDNGSIAMNGLRPTFHYASWQARRPQANCSLFIKKSDDAPLAMTASGDGQWRLMASATAAGQLFIVHYSLFILKG
jgi:hypothetical protein